MTTIGSYEAKTHLPQLLERVAQGEKIIITRRGVPIALLSPASTQEKQDTEAVISDMLAYRKSRNRTLGKLSTRQLIQEGRRF